MPTEGRSGRIDRGRAGMMAVACRVRSAPSGHAEYLHYGRKLGRSVQLSSRGRGILWMPARSTAPHEPHLVVQGWQQGGPVDNTEGVLRRAPLFDALDDEGARTLRKQMAEVKLSRGEHLFMEGDDGDALYVVIEGKMKLTRAAADGRENLLSVIGPGEMFGELSLFDPRPRTSSASAVTDAVLASLKHEALTPWLRERPEVSLHMLRALAQRLRRANDVTADLVFTDVPGRVAKNLLDLAERFGNQEPDGLHVHHDLTQEELAQLVGASRETVNKALADFAARGWLQISARSVLILDAERLRKRARLGTRP